MTKDAHEVTADFYFAIVPEWVLDLPISSNAIRVYCMLRRYADYQTGQCYPSRKLLAMRCRVSVSTLDRALTELDENGAITIEHRKSSTGDYTSNLYTVRTIPKGVASPVSRPLIARARTGGITGGEQTKAISSISNKTPPYQNHSHMLTMAGANARLGIPLSECLLEWEDSPHRDELVQVYKTVYTHVHGTAPVE